MAEVKKKAWKAPPRRYFGPKDPETGETLDEPEYQHTGYPKVLYHPTDGDITVNSEDEHAELGAEWSEKPHGPMTHPSQEDLKAERLAKLKGKGK